MRTPIAARTFDIAPNDDNPATTVTLALYAPRMSDDPGGPWDCDVEILEKGATRLYPIHGVDSLQCLCLGLHMFRCQVASLSARYESRITYMGESDIAL